MKYLFFIFLLPISLMGQNRAPKGFIFIKAKKENFERYITIPNPTESQVDTLIQLGRNYTQVSRDSSLLLIDRVINICQDKEEDDWQNRLAKVLNSKAASLENREGIDLLEKAKTIFEKVGNERGIASSERILGSIYINEGNYKEAIDAYLNSIKIYKETKTDVRALLNPLEGVSTIYHKIGNYKKAEFYLSQAIAIADTTDSFHRKSSLRLNQSNQYKEVANLHKNNNRLDSFRVYTDLSFSAANNALINAEEQNDPLQIYNSLEVLSILNTEKGQYENALELAKEMIPIAEKLGDPYRNVKLDICLSQAHNGLNNTGMSWHYAQKALEESKEKGFNEEVVKSYDLLISAAIKDGQRDKALDLFEERNEFYKNFNSLATKKAITEAETKFQTAEKENQILQQKNDILLLESKNEANRKRLFLLFGAGSLFGIFSFFWSRFAKIRKERNDKREFAEALIMTQEEERKRISRDLHDGVGQSLLLIKKQVSDTDTISAQSKQLISETLEEVRSISRNLHPSQLDNFGLTKAIDYILTTVENSTDIFISKEIENIDEAIPKKEQIHIYRTIQEAMNNIIKHAEASAAKIEIKKNDSEILIKIQDNGKGFNMDSKGTAMNSLGLRTMKERISSIGGILNISPGKEKGTIIEIKKPAH